ncbi:MAG: hypothetical protein HFI11_10035 [Lachnospiraceae bacterium]|nr:hypothetical protein [Lachnospiraceae bacterium]
MGITVNAGKIPIFQRMQQKGLKSREEKAERQQNRDNQVAALEKQKADLKNMECGSFEEIEDKLGLLHSYEDQIKAVKQTYNNEQMRHILDEAREKGEKIAEELEKLAPMTKEEREELLQKEALGIDEDQGMLSELTDELTEELTEEPDKELSEETAGEITGEAAEEVMQEAAGEITGEAAEDVMRETAEEPAEGTAGETAVEIPKEASMETAEKAAEKLPQRESEKLAEQHHLEMQEQAKEKEKAVSITEEALSMHGKARVGIERYLDYYHQMKNRS